MAKTETNTTKLTKDEIKEIGDIRSSVSNVTIAIGETEVAFANLEIRKNELLNNLKKLSEKQNDFANKLEDKYGNGSVNLDTGEFVPVKE